MKFLKSIFAVAIAAMAFCACTNEFDNEYKQNEVKLRTENEAISIAISAHKAFFGNDSRATSTVDIAEGGVHVVKGRSSRGMSNDTLLYVVNYEDNGGFAVVSASPTAIPLIGIAEEGNYQPEEEQENSNFQFYLDRICEHIGNSMEQPSSLSISIPIIPIGPDLPPRDSIPFSNIYTVLASKGPYVELKWGQGYPYGSRFANGRCGSVPPVVGMIAATLWSPQYDYLDAIHDYIDWEEICNHKGNGAECTESNPTATHNKIADLMKSIDEQCDYYYVNGGLRYYPILDDAFLSIHSDEDMTLAEPLSDINEVKFWIDQIEDSRYNRSLFYATECTPTEYLSSEYVQHCWIIDGYKVAQFYFPNGEPTTYFHCNWACDGNSNGYFLPDSYLSVLSYDNTNHSYSTQINGAIRYGRVHITTVVGNSPRQ